MGVSVDGAVVSEENPFEEWNVAFHGTRLETLRQVAIPPCDT